MEDKIILKFKTKNILNFHEIEPGVLILICAIVEQSINNKMVSKI